eukprot:gene2986-3803_t
MTRARSRDLRSGAVDSLEAGHSGEKGVIHETIVEQHYMQRAEQRDWVRDSAIVSHVVREVPWYLEDGSGTVVGVSGGRTADGLHMSTVAEAFEPHANGMLSKGFDYLRGMKELGVLRTDRMLTVGTQVTVVGELNMVNGKQGRVLDIHRPPAGKPFYITPMSVEDLLGSLSRYSGSKWCQFGGVACPCTAWMQASILVVSDTWACAMVKGDD